MSPVWAGGQVLRLLVRRRVDGAGQPRAAPQACASRWPAQLSGTRTVRSFFCELNFNLGCLDFMGCPSRLPQILATLCVWSSRRPGGPLPRFVFDENRAGDPTVSAPGTLCGICPRPTRNRETSGCAVVLTHGDKPLQCG